MALRPSKQVAQLLALFGGQIQSSGLRALKRTQQKGTTPKGGETNGHKVGGTSVHLGLLGNLCRFALHNVTPKELLPLWGSKQKDRDQTSP